MTRLIPSEDELHAYVDERLAPGRRAEVQAWLATNPQAAARVEGWRADARRLRTALAGFGESTGAAQLDLRQLRGRLRERRQRRWAVAAAMVLALGVGGLGGWQVRDASLARADLPMADAVQAHRLFVGSQTLDIQASDPGQLRDWLGRHFSRVGRLPDLAGYGFKPVGARLLSNEQGPAALLVFEDGAGQRISLFLRSPGEQYRRMPEGQRIDGQLEARYWSHGAYNFALVSAADDVRGAGVGEVLRLGL
ncbi:anti-sigma factor [Pseudomonas sp. CM25]|uniref:anti-sigma factor family protein n=1 Tax=unclassified Pseudomonas TaxID=196821 RepID=UPI0015528783|nr:MULTISPECIES: anti-sigma factor [unclassified Pseudomonas]NQD58232.1 anti-sigma factor [Pseudomonas sp. CM25]NQD75265.1 anti-sigma factor [Pseudomonas sp. CM27]HEN8799372.1 anti-sigma factor [Pseudomonas putida]